MVKYAIGLVVGIFLTIVGTVGAQVMVRGNAQEPRAGLISEINRIVNTYCDVQVGKGSWRKGDTCYRNDVLVGVKGEYIKCAVVAVDCFTSIKK